MIRKLSTISVARFYLRKFKNYLHFLRTGKRSLLGGVVKVQFVCLEGYGRLLQISQNKIVKYTGVPSSTKQKQTPANATKISPWHHQSFLHIHGPNNSTANEGYLGLH